MALPLPRGGRRSKSYSCVLIFAGGIKVVLIALSPLCSPAVVRRYTLINIGFVWIFSNFYDKFPRIIFKPV